MIFQGLTHHPDAVFDLRIGGVFSRVAAHDAVMRTSRHRTPRAQIKLITQKSKRSPQPGLQLFLHRRHQVNDFSAVFVSHRHQPVAVFMRVGDAERNNRG